MAPQNPHLAGPEPTIEAATRSSRLLARVVDAGVWLAPLPLLFFPCLGGLAALGLLAALVVAQTALLVTRGQTLGKKALQIYIMRSDGSIPHAGWLLLREFGIPALVFVLRTAGGHDPSPVGQALQGLLGTLWLVDALFIFGPTRRCLHDLVAGTHVVKVG